MRYGTKIRYGVGVALAGAALALSGCALVGDGWDKCEFYDDFPKPDFEFENDSMCSGAGQVSFTAEKEDVAAYVKQVSEDETRKKLCPDEDGNDFAGGTPASAPHYYATWINNDYQCFMVHYNVDTKEGNINVDPRVFNK